MPWEARPRKYDETSSAGSVKSAPGTTWVNAAAASSDSTHSRRLTRSVTNGVTKAAVTKPAPLTTTATARPLNAASGSLGSWK